MHKQDLARKISKKNDTTLKAAEEFLDAFTEIVTETLAKQYTVRLAGFGTWEVRTYTARTGRNPKTGEAVEIPEFCYPAFKAGKHLKEAVAGKEPQTLGKRVKRKNRANLQDR